MLEHGGHLIEAAKKYNIPLAQWIDLSTGINPNGWPIPAIPTECWQRLPESTDGLLNAARQYYQCQSILAVAGSQAAIQALPLLRKKSKVGVLAPAYAEHAYSWKKAGHEVIELNNIETQIENLDVLILINPNNPTGQHYTKQQLIDWQQQLKKRDGWLIVDEAYIDSNPEQSLASYPATEGLIILRSIGKFFGLAGIRCGFVIATETILSQLNEHLGPWTISHPSRYIATAALLDFNWQKKTQTDLKNQRKRLTLVLENNGLKVSNQTDLFQWIKTNKAEEIYQKLAQQGILTRLFTDPLSIRFGLPKDENQWQQLDKVLSKVVSAHPTLHNQKRP